MLKTKYPIYVDVEISVRVYDIIKYMYLYGFDILSFVVEGWFNDHY